jgi:hypothetical protein
VTSHYLSRREAGCQELVEEGPAFLSSGDSSKPVGRAGLNVGRQGPLEDKLGRKHQATRNEHAGQLTQDGGSRGVEVEDSIDDGDIEGSCLGRDPLGVP